MYALLRPTPEAANESDADFDGLPDVWELTIIWIRFPRMPGRIPTGTAGPTPWNSSWGSTHGMPPAPCVSPSNVPRTWTSPDAGRSSPRRDPATWWSVTRPSPQAGSSSAIDPPPRRVPSRSPCCSMTATPVDYSGAGGEVLVSTPLTECTHTRSGRGLSRKHAVGGK